MYNQLLQFEPPNAENLIKGTILLHTTYMFRTSLDHHLGAHNCTRQLNLPPPKTSESK